MTARSSTAPILEALTQLELKLTTLISAGLLQIKEEHSRAVLEQAKLNATFASRDALDQLRSHTDTHSAQIVTLAARWEESAADRKQLRTAIEATNDLVTNRTLGTYDRVAGWAVGGGLSVFAIIVSFALNHLIH